MVGYKKKDIPHPSPQYLLTTGEKKKISPEGKDRIEC